MADSYLLSDGAAVVRTTPAPTLDPSHKYPHNVLKPHATTLDTPSGVVTVTDDWAYKAPVPPVNPPSPPAAGPTTAAPFKTSTWFDDFSEGLNPAYWSTGKLGAGVTAPFNGEETACYDPANVVPAADGLHLKLTAKPQAGKQYSGACVNTNGKVKWQVGQYAGMRVVVPVSATGKVLNWPQGWSDGQSWPTDGEIDIFEGLGGILAYHFHGPQNAGAGVGGGYPGDLGGVLHEIGAFRNPATGNADFYLDGKYIHSVSEQGVSADHYLILVNSCGTAGGATQAGVDAVWASVGLWTP